ncbi:tyrosine-protein kinase [Plakobranchus ocellatus]|uniref:Tyrosine-protein kinase n=1 Tax=Plakobranchus ocellatus TaxID=259542 RepID=A0AAV4DBW5_9GAST|nr:tyrosine-protein kinase [Plakobranchus ocellatus]
MFKSRSKHFESFMYTTFITYLEGESSPHKVRALYNFDAINDGDLSFKKGDIMEVDETTQETDGWWLAVHCDTHKRGYIPSKYVIKDDTSPQAQE